MSCPEEIDLMSCPVDPVVAQVVAHGRDQPRPDGVPGQCVDPVVVVDVDVGNKQVSVV